MKLIYAKEQAAGNLMDCPFSLYKSQSLLVNATIITFTDWLKGQ
jgi:hypothetical protein